MDAPSAQHEDVHWADPSTLELFDRGLDQPDGSKYLVTVTTEMIC